MHVSAVMGLFFCGLQVYISGGIYDNSTPSGPDDHENWSAFHENGTEKRFFAPKRIRMTRKRQERRKMREESEKDNTNLCFYNGYFGNHSQGTLGASPYELGRRDKLNFVFCLYGKFNPGYQDEKCPKGPQNTHAEPRSDLSATLQTMRKLANQDTRI